MGSSYFGEPNMSGNERRNSTSGTSSTTSSSSSSSRKGKKKNNNNINGIINSEKQHQQQPKQPQRGLGVAQLEKIRLTAQLGYNHHHPSYHITPNYPSIPNQEDIRAQPGYSSTPMSSYAYNPNNMMGSTGEYERRNIIYGDTQPSAVQSWNPLYEDHQHPLQPNAAKHLFNRHETTSRRKKHKSTDSIGSNSQNSDSSDSQELDLELKLSL